MSQFKFLNDMNNLLNLDGELKNQSKPRWQRKMESSMNGSVNASKLSVSYNNSFMTAMSGTSMTTGNKTPNKSTIDVSCSKKKTPNDKKSPGRKTPTRGGNVINNNGSKTPSGGDRFIPNRVATNFELGHYLMKQEQQKTDGNENSTDNNQKSPSNKVRALSEAMHGMDISKKRILTYQTKAPAAPESHINPLRVVYSVKTPSSSKSGTRFIPTNPERILDAPDILNDYYLNLLDWSSANIVTVALGTSVYLWNAESGNVEILFEKEANDHACSLEWIQEGHILAVGTNNGNVELWDCSKMRRLRIMTGHSARVGALAWNSYVVSSGSRDGSIIHHDVRQRDHLVSTLNGHSQEVCGLKWSPDLKYLASGGNDNLVNIWGAESGSNMTGSAPIHVLNDHQAAVRALAWCPWQSNILASGGGTADRCIKFWNVSNGTCANSVDTNSQVCSLLFSKNYKELISAHGYANNQLTIWKYPSMIKQADLTGHSQRVLQLAMSPDGSTVMSAGADETLRLWNCFAPDPHFDKKKITKTEKTSFLLKQSIR
ncbi:CLUMA_CG004808, isoform A [Clunio marinus]|uniref:Cell division cycle protein 20 homolog n=1 Tax=Clunio marinus TaxID=568069 RepID=A0A1J1HSS0_9DIPT|nr:CLUMA_CG004808, isoform A [Clunio marinus]